MNPTENPSTGIAAGRIVRRQADGSCECADDELAVEEPLEIRVGSEPLALTMRTPGHDEELVAGFLLSEGIVRTRSDVRELSHCALAASQGNILNVQLSPRIRLDPNLTRRFGMISASCGLCGKAGIGAIRQNFPVLTRDPSVRVSESVLLDLPPR